jgi:nuclear pore complex protein Nup85
MEEPFDATSYVHWTSICTTFHFFQTLLTPQSGLITGLVGEELLLWLNVNFVAPTTDDGRRYANKEKPWLEEGFWMYLVR